MLAVSLVAGLTALSLHVRGQFVSPGFNPPAPVIPSSPLVTAADTILTTYAVGNAIPQNYNDILRDEIASDLSTPSNIRTVTEYDPDLGCYVIRTKLGERDITTPFYLTPEQFNEWQNRQSMRNYFRERNAESVRGAADKEPFNILDMNFALGPLEKIFGPGGVSQNTGFRQHVNGYKVKQDRQSRSVS